jgi:hypothetical protein
MVYELRTYWAAHGKMDLLHKRFRELTLNLFKRHNIEVIAFWTPIPATEETGDLVYIVRFADEDASRSAWDAFRSDPEWVAGKTASEVDGSLVTRVTSITLQPADYSPLV